MKYKCLVLDHDDTIVNSTKMVHHPAFVQYLSQVRPDVSINLEDYLRYNFDPGFIPLCRDILKLNDEEMALENQVWQNYVSTHVPVAFEGISEILHRFVREKGIICVVSHSYKHNIERDYKANHLPLPALIYGWELPAHLRKPAAYPLEMIMKELHLSASDLLMVDDLKPGKIMADACQVDFAGVGWSHQIPEIEAYMKKECRYYFKTVEEFEHFLFD